MDKCKETHGEIIKYLGDPHWTCVECDTKFNNHEIAHVVKEDLNKIHAYVQQVIINLGGVE